MRDQDTGLSLGSMSEDDLEAQIQKLRKEQALRQQDKEGKLLQAEPSSPDPPQPCLSHQQQQQQPKQSVSQQQQQQQQPVQQQAKQSVSQQQQQQQPVQQQAKQSVSQQQQQQEKEEEVKGDKQEGGEKPRLGAGRRIDAEEEGSQAAVDTLLFMQQQLPSANRPTPAATSQLDKQQPQTLPALQLLRQRQQFPLPDRDSPAPHLGPARHSERHSELLQRGRSGSEDKSGGGRQTDQDCKHGSGSGWEEDVGRPSRREGKPHPALANREAAHRTMLQSESAPQRQRSPEQQQQLSRKSSREHHHHHQQQHHQREASKPPPQSHHKQRRGGDQSHERAHLDPVDPDHPGLAPQWGRLSRNTPHLSGNNQSTEQGPPPIHNTRSSTAHHPASHRDRESSHPHPAPRGPERAPSQRLARRQHSERAASPRADSPHADSDGGGRRSAATARDTSSPTPMDVDPKNRPPQQQLQPPPQKRRQAPAPAEGGAPSSRAHAQPRGNNHHTNTNHHTNSNTTNNTNSSSNSNSHAARVEGAPEPEGKNGGPQSHHQQKLSGNAVNPPPPPSNGAPPEAPAPVSASIGRVRSAPAPLMTIYAYRQPASATAPQPPQGPATLDLSVGHGSGEMPFQRLNLSLRPPSHTQPPRHTFAPILPQLGNPSSLASGGNNNSSGAQQQPGNNPAPGSDLDARAGATCLGSSSSSVELYQASAPSAELQSGGWDRSAAPGAGGVDDPCTGGAQGDAAAGSGSGSQQDPGGRQGQRLGA
ncbi:MAG: hypothetical protein WDW38_006019 [Sanguina aurantia]